MAPFAPVDVVVDVVVVAVAAAVDCCRCCCCCCFDIAGTENSGDTENNTD